MDYNCLSPSLQTQLQSLSRIFQNYVAEQESPNISMESDPQNTILNKDKWTDLENELFLSAVQNLKFNKPAQIASVVKTRSTQQVISHQQKFKIKLNRIYEEAVENVKNGTCEEETIGTALEYIRNVLKIDCNSISINLNIQEHLTVKEGVLQLNKQLVRQMVRLPHKMVSAYKAIIAEIQKPVIALQFVAKKQNVSTGVAAMVIFVSK
ncbi:Myb-like_DNA-binding domain-containing protein [Hexamita inflata]|uniref:Myb-like DNA-binding domain-containing protein n=1 Tax=Hexamita inflata TaxID=28002 RepID=A0AA86UI32_9EUKA|nr:Myb-like DNA-binding domain-containing protein [Hexamita inflata]